MTANDVMIKALQRINYTNTRGFVDMGDTGDIAARSLDAINFVLADLQRILGVPNTTITSLHDTVPLPDDILDRVMPWGVAMMIAQSESDGDNQQYAANMYNGLRNSFPRQMGRHIDVIPKPYT